MDTSTLRVLEYSKVLEMVSSFAVTPEGRDRVRHILPLHTQDAVLERFGLIGECRRILTEGRPLGLEPMEPLVPLFQRLRPEESVLEPLQLRAFLPLLYSAEALKRLSAEIDLPGIKRLLSGLTTHPEIRKAIERSIDRDGLILDEASPELYEIRMSIKSLDRRIKSILERILNTRELKPHIQDFYITERNGRRVIPVKRDSKGHIPGVIHDISNTGETIFVEPTQTVQLGNELEGLKAEEKVEEFRILKRLSTLLRQRLAELENDHDIVLEMDLIQSLASFAEEIGAEIPEINRKGLIRIQSGRHPLLWRAFKKAGRESEIVPLDFELGRSYTALVITGPNAGGKTVVLKTVGILTLMALSGIPVPAGSGSTFPFVRNVFADIGDEQSIEQDISTFSGHVLKLTEILRSATSDTLVILDELGTGTDPDEGGALACAILRRLKHRGVLTLVSTHLSMLKAFAYSEDGLENGSMQMRRYEEGGAVLYRPTYRLKIGEAGQSHALEIAKRLGLPDDLIREAKDLLGEKERRLETLIASLQEKETGLAEKLEEIDRLKEELQTLKASLREEIKIIKEKKTEILNDYRQKAEAIYRKAVSEAEDILKRIKSEERQKAREHLRRLKKRYDDIKVEKQKPSEELGQPVSTVEVGQVVLVGSLGMEGVVKTVNRNAKRCRVVVRGRELDVSFDDLYLPPEKDDRKDIPSEERPSEGQTPETEEITSAEINLVGERVDPALSALERYLNDASLSGLKEVRVIHGIGTGRLAQAVREYLKDHPLVRDFRPGRREEGGEGVTVVYL